MTTPSRLVQLRRRRLAAWMVAAACLWAAGRPASAEVSITKLWPDKVRYLAGEEATIAVQVKNAGAQPWTGRVSGEIESGLDRKTPVFDREVTLAAGEERRLEEKYRVDLGEFGHAIHVTADGPGGSAEAREVFCVGPWYYNMGRCLTIFSLMTYKTPEQVLAAFEPKWRGWYVTVIEHYSGSPGQWNGLTPTAEAWHSGQSGFQESIAGERAVIAAAHSQGIAETIYEINGTCAMVGEEYSRAHPDWIAYNSQGRPQGYFNMGDMDLWRTNLPETAVHGCPLWLGPDISKPEVQDACLDDIIRCSKMFGFDGIRWDGQLIGAGYTIDGQHIDVDLDAQNAAWNAKMRTTLMDALPGYTVNYNYHPQSQPEGIPLPKTYKTLGPHAYLLWESMRGKFKDPNDPLNHWTNFIAAVRAEINGYARPNGNFQHFGWYACDSTIQQNHSQAIYYALGGHWDTWTPLKYDAFAMRFGAHLWDTGFKNLDDGSTRVEAISPGGRLWWKQFVQERPRPGGGRIIVTHLLNQPVHERQDAFEKDAPPPQTDIKVALTPPAGETVLKAFVLNPDTDRAHWCTEVQPVLEGGKASLVVPSVEYWSFVVWETGK